MSFFCHLIATFLSLPRQSPDYSNVFVSSDRDNKGQKAPEDGQDEPHVQGSNSSPAHLEEEVTAESQWGPKPPPQSSKPKLGNTREHHLEENSANAGLLRSNERLHLFGGFTDRS